MDVARTCTQAPFCWSVIDRHDNSKTRKQLWNDRRKGKIVRNVWLETKIVQNVRLEKKIVPNVQQALHYITIIYQINEHETSK